jgi:hypothetical protein
MNRREHSAKKAFHIARTATKKHFILLTKIGRTRHSDPNGTVSVYGRQSPIQRPRVLRPSPAARRSGLPSQRLLHPDSKRPSDASQTVQKISESIPPPDDCFGSTRSV